MTKEIIIQRLTRIKHLYRLGVEQSKKPELISFSSILSFHDAMDMFMHIAAEKVNLSKKGNNNPSLMQYFQLIPQLTLEPSVRKINERRINLKHFGQIPAKSEIDESAIITNLFFEENTKTIFDLEFSDVSLASLVHYESVKKYLQNAEAYLNSQKYKEAIDEVAKAYYEMTWEVIDNSKRKEDMFDVTNITRVFPTISRETGEALIKPEWVNNLGIPDEELKIGKETLEIVLTYNHNFSIISQALNSIAIGLDYSKYVRYSSFMPQVLGVGNQGEYVVSNLKLPNLDTEENAWFAFDFVLDFALRHGQ